MGKISNVISNANFAKFSKATAVTVYLMTGVKAAVRPVFIMGDMKNDPETKKYTATKEVLYQLLCLGIAAAMIPFAERIGFKMAEKYIKNIKGLEKITKYNQIPEFNKINKLKEFKEDYLAKSFDGKLELSKEAEEAMHIVNGGVETGSFIASILGLTLLAPMVSHEILHPIMHAIGMGKKESVNPALEKLEQPILEEGHHKIDKQA